MLAHKPGLQPEDYEVLIRLLLRDPGLPSGILALSEEFQASGWKTGASRLRGVVQRLKKAYHVRHTQAGYGPATGRPRWEFAVYRNPANNPQYVGQGLDAASQVSPMVRKPTRRSRPPYPWGRWVLPPSPTAAPAVTRAPGHRLRRGGASMCFVKREGGFDLGFDLLRGA
ncbi:hypothetical protein LUW77_00220 [Streptomyces radiopugnans]|nr:hypothetical protein LUW77_00220 [Streptomyces radiopugnans]